MEPVVAQGVGRELATMNDQINQSLVRERLMATLSGGFGVLGLFLAMVGLFAVLSYNVVQRRRARRDYQPSRRTVTGLTRAARRAGAQAAANATTAIRSSAAR